MTIAEARRVYRELRDRAKELNPDEADYIDLLWLSWDGRLAEIGDETEVDCWHLVLAVNSPTLSADAYLEWMDAYPGGIEWRWEQSA